MEAIRGFVVDQLIPGYFLFALCLAPVIGGMAMFSRWIRRKEEKRVHRDQAASVEFEIIQRQLRIPMANWMQAGPQGSESYHKAAMEYERVRKDVDQKMVEWRRKYGQSL